MTTRTRLAIAALTSALAIAVGGAVFASASVETLPAHNMISDQSNDEKWVGSASRDLRTGRWRATITRGDEKILLPGEYSEEKYAEAAAKDEAKKRNKASDDKEKNDKVMDGPGCEPPLVVC